MGRKPLEEGRVGASNVAPSPKGYGMKPGKGFVSESVFEPGVDGPEVFDNQSMISANTSVVGGSERRGTGSVMHVCTSDAV
jgi:hypothetical protein